VTKAALVSANESVAHVLEVVRLVAGSQEAAAAVQVQIAEPAPPEVLTAIQATLVSRSVPVTARHKLASAVVPGEAVYKQVGTSSFSRYLHLAFAVHAVPSVEMSIAAQAFASAVTLGTSLVL